MALVFLFQLASCGGGGGGGGSSSTKMGSMLEEQNNKAEKYFSKMSEAAQTAAQVEEWIATVDPSDTTSTEAIKRTVEDYLSPLVEEAYTAGQGVFQAEEGIQGSISARQRGEAPCGPNPEVQAAITGAVILTACVTALSAAAFTVSLNDNMKNFKEALKACGDQHNANLDSIPAGVSGEKYQEFVDYYWQVYKSCVDKANSDANWEDAKAGLSTLVSNLAPGAVSWRTGKVAVQSTSSALDVTTIYVIGTDADSSGQRADARDNGAPQVFLAETDSNGEFSAPEGDWNMVMFSPGQARFGTGDGQSVTVGGGQTTRVDARTTSASSATGDDLATCDTGGGDSGDDGGGDGGGEEVITYPATYEGTFSINSGGCVSSGPIKVIIYGSYESGSATATSKATSDTCYEPSNPQWFTWSGSHINGHFTLDFASVPITGTYNANSMSGSGSKTGWSMTFEASRTD